MKTMMYVFDDLWTVVVFHFDWNQFDYQHVLLVNKFDLVVSMISAVGLVEGRVLDFVP